VNNRTVPAETEVLGPEVREVERLATLGTIARGGADLLKVWLKSHQNVSPHTVRLYRRIERCYAASGTCRPPTARSS
jgi:hypothetical protein